jgi:hypothetical protein
MPSHAEIFTWNPVQPVQQHPSTLASTRTRQQQHGDSMVTMVTMATAIFVTKQQPTVNIIISITQIVLTIVDDAVLLSLILVLLLKGTIWLDMVST